MDFRDVMQQENADFSEIAPSFFLVGLLSFFDNRFQAKADKFFEEISWKQLFAIICIELFQESPTIKELAEIMGSSHQNVKQILLKLERKGFVEISVDEADRRKQRISLTEKAKTFSQTHEAGSHMAVKKIFDGISKEQLQITIQTILQMESNLNAL